MRRTQGNGRSQTFPFPTRWAELPDLPGHDGHRGHHGPLAYFDAGLGEALVFVHGLVGDFSHFEHVAPAFVDGYRVAGIDLPGCGISPKPASRHSIDGYARTLLAWMTRVGIPRATLVGHSMGGLVCARAALMAPSRVTRLVLINSAGLRPYAAPVRWLARGLLRRWLLAATLERLAMPMLGHVFAARNRYTEKFVADALDRPVHPTLGEMAKVFEDLTPDLLRPTILDRAQALTQPVLMLWGDADRLIPIEGVTRAARALPRCTLRVLPGCGHMPIIESPAAVVDALREFLRGEVTPHGTSDTRSDAPQAA